MSFTFRFTYGRKFIFNTIIIVVFDVRSKRTNRNERERECWCHNSNSKRKLYVARPSQEEPISLCVCISMYSDVFNTRQFALLWWNATELAQQRNKKQNQKKRTHRLLDEVREKSRAGFVFISWSAVSVIPFHSIPFHFMGESINDNNQKASLALAINQRDFPPNTGY